MLQDVLIAQAAEGDGCCHQLAGSRHPLTQLGQLATSLGLQPSRPPGEVIQVAGSADACVRRLFAAVS